jgi:hypothetical protein
MLSPAALTIQDSVTGAGDHSIIARFPLHPAVTLLAGEQGGWRLELAGSRVLRVKMSGCAESFVTGGWYAPTFGQRMSRPVLAWRHSGRLPLNVETRFEL